MGSLPARSNRQDLSGPEMSSTNLSEKITTGILDKISVSEMLHSLSFEPLKESRKIHRLRTFHQAHNNIIALPVAHHYQQSLRLTRSQSAYIKPCARNNYYFFNFFQELLRIGICSPLRLEQTFIVIFFKITLGIIRKFNSNYFFFFLIFY